MPFTVLNEPFLDRDFISLAESCLLLVIPPPRPSDLIVFLTIYSHPRFKIVVIPGIPSITVIY
jgi:hypothetical protein